MRALREALRNNPMVGWIAASALALLAAWLLFLRPGGTNEVKALAEEVTIRDVETGDTWQVRRATMEEQLYSRPYPVEVGQGLINPKTGKPNGFPIDAWKETVMRINAERKTLAEAQHQPPSK